MKPIATTSTAMLALTGALIATALAVAAPSVKAQTLSPNDGPVRLAQSYDPSAAGGEVYIDEYGRRVTIDANGRIVGVEQPRRDQFRARRERIQNRGAVIDAPPPPGVSVEGRVFPDQQGGFYDPNYNSSTNARGRDARELPVDPGYGNGGGYQDRRVYREGPDGRYPNNGGFDQPGRGVTAAAAGRPGAGQFSPGGGPFTRRGRSKPWEQ